MSALRAMLAALALLAAPAALPGELPDDSLYLLATPLVTQDGAAVTLALDRGRPVLISMFYASCPNSCPILIESVRQMERKLPPASRDRLRVLLVSIDPARDTPEKLKDLAQRHGADLSRWTFGRADEAEVRKLAAALGVRYRALPNGDFNHSTVVSLLDADGRIVIQTSKLPVPDADFTARLREATAK